MKYLKLFLVVLLPLLMGCDEQFIDDAKPFGEFPAKWEKVGENIFEIFVRTETTFCYGVCIDVYDRALKYGSSVEKGEGDNFTVKYGTRVMCTVNRKDPNIYRVEFAADAHEVEPRIKLFFEKEDSNILTLFDATYTDGHWVPEASQR